MGGLLNLSRTLQPIIVHVICDYRRKEALFKFYWQSASGPATVQLGTVPITLAHPHSARIMYIE